METYIIEEADYVLLGATRAALEKAQQLCGRATVLIVTESTCLAEEICDTCRYEEPEPGFLPDRFQLALEEKCDALGIRLLYFLKYVDQLRLDGRILVRVAAKGGLYGILCRELLDFRQELEAEHYAAWITGEEGENVRLLPVSVPPASKTDAPDGLARQLFVCRKALIGEFLRRREQEPGLFLGRFARKPYGSGKSCGQALSAGDGKACRGQTVRVWAPGQNRLGRYRACELEESRAAVYAGREDWDLVVAGGGTAGVMAALHAARGGLRTLLLEPDYDLGGTQTLGGVSTYWFGNRFSDVREIDGEVDRLCTACGVRKRKGIWSEKDDFHAGLKGFVYLKLCLEAGVTVLFGQLAYGAVCQNGRIEAVLSAGAAGNRADYAKAVIDATGDGDLAVAAGADSCYGSERDMITYWGSLAQYVSPDAYRNNFSSMLFAEDPLDYTRFIRLGRRRGEGLFEHGSYVSMRESRHIRGMRTVDLRDLMLYRTYEDGLYTCFSNYDPKGKLDADMIYCGVLPPQVRIQIPLSALLAADRQGKRIEGLYVAGKAVSATHNVFPSIRMQPDLMHQGAVLGALLARAAKEGTCPERMDSRARRAFLLSYTDDDLRLPKFCLSGQECARQTNERTRRHWVDVPFLYEERGSSPALGLMAAKPQEVREILTERLTEAADPALRETLMGYALWHGMEEWTEEFAALLCRKLRACRTLPEREGSTMCAQLLPDHGVMPELVYQLNQLGWSRRRAVLEPFSLLLERLREQERDYLDIRRGMFHYVETFAYAALHSDWEEWKPMLLALLALPELKGVEKICGSADLMTERYQILAFLLLRALACRGGREGYEGLLRFLESDNMALRGSALLTLERLFGKSSGPALSLRDWEALVGRTEPLPACTIREKRW
ncbi:MAG: FAD-dependent oxidoreductase [Eubacteriales bacterium]|nr:FAD-dependent oxidoreductase [Eubacteriales bacterium]